MVIAVRGLCLALLVMPAPLIAQRYEYAPSTGQYRVSAKTRGAQEGMGPRQEFETQADYLLSVTIARPSKDTMDLTIAIDSIAMVGPMGMAPMGVDRAMGLQILAKLSPSGQRYSVQAPSDEVFPGASQMVDEISHFLPHIRTALSVGATWSDTTSAKMEQMGVAIDRNVVSTFRVIGDTTIGGNKAWKVERESRTAMEGSGAAQGQTMDLKGTATTKSVMLLGQNGVFAGSDSAEQAGVTITIPTNNLQIIVSTNATTTITKVK